MITQSPGLPEAVRINATHLYEGMDGKTEERLSNCQRSLLTAVDEERGRKANRLLESTGTVEKESEAVSRRHSSGLKHADKFDELEERMTNYQGFHPCIKGPRPELFGRQPF